MSSGWSRGACNVNGVDMAGKPSVMSQRHLVHPSTHTTVGVKDSNGYFLPLQDHQYPTYGIPMQIQHKQLELLDSRCGMAGSTVEKQKAAQIIQYNFKQYTLSRNFQRLRSTHDELRIQRLMTDISSDKDSVWSDVEVTSHPTSPHKPIKVVIDQPEVAVVRERDSVTSSSPPSSPDNFQVCEIDDDSYSYVKSPYISDSRLHDVQLRFSNCSGKSRKRQYRIGLTLFNRKPEQGIKYLMEQRFLTNSSRAVAEFLLGRKGLSKQMIGVYLGNLQSPFNQDVLVCIMQSFKFHGIDVDQALRKMVNYFRLPGEAQQIQRIIERFSQWYCSCNSLFVKQFNSVDTIFLISYAIIMLNTDLHNPSIKATSKMKLDQFIKNLKGIDNESDVPSEMLIRIYERVQDQELRVGPDHVSQVRKVERTLVGKIPQLAVPERRLVCYCRLYEVADPNKKEKLGLHQREIFLFNDVLVITKIYAKKKQTITYTFRRSIMINDVVVQSFTNDHYHYGIRLVSGQTKATILCFNARNNHDREKFVDDLVDSVMELKEMRTVQTGNEARKRSIAVRSRMSKDSGVSDLELSKPPESMSVQVDPSKGAGSQERSTSLTELHASKGLVKCHSNRSVDSCVVTRKSHRV